MPIMSDFQLVKYEIHKLYIEIPPDCRIENTDSINYMAKLRTTYLDGAWQGGIQLGFQQTAKHNPSSILFEVIIGGVFRYVGENDDNTRATFKKFLQGSGAATLIPIARAAVVSASAITGHPGICSIPNINVFQMAWHDEDSEEDALIVDGPT